MFETLTVDIVTPEKLALSASGVDAVTLPAFDGEMGVLPGHSPFLVQLGAGVIRIRQGSDVKTFAVSAGFADVNRDRIAVFAETAELSEEIDAEQARQQLEKAKGDMLKPGLDPMTLMAAEAAARRAAVRLKVAELRKAKKT